MSHLFRCSIFIFAAAVLLSCLSTSKRDIASQEKDSVSEGIQQSFESLRGRAKNIPGFDHLETLSESEQVEDILEKDWSNRISTVVRHSTLLHIMNALDGAIEKVDGKEISDENKAAMVSVSGSIIVMAGLVAPQLNRRFPIISKWKKGVKVLGKRRMLSRMPRALVRGVFLTAGFVVSDKLIHQWSSSYFIEMDI